jgi:DNA-binding NtrC family response regulator
MENKKRVLYVDDDEQIILVQQQILERFGYDVSPYLNPVDALEDFRLASERYDIAIIDLVMPSLNGDLLAREIKKVNPVLPIILCTGYGAEIVEKQVSELGIEGFLVKPIAYKVMLEMVSRLLKGNS